jgi:hypothetical protein
MASWSHRRRSDNAGHLHRAKIGTFFGRAYVSPADTAPIPSVLIEGAFPFNAHQN